MSTSAMIGPGLLIGVYLLIILKGISLAIMEKRRESEREH